jgi:hypothetical protein
LEISVVKVESKKLSATYAPINIIEQIRHKINKRKKNPGLGLSHKGAGPPN